MKTKVQGKIKVGKPFTPSTIINSEVIDAMAIEISCGGGMGGAHWVEYTTDDFNLDDKRILVNTNLCVNHSINTDFIVSTFPVKIIKLTLRNDGNCYIGEVGSIVDYLYVVNFTHAISFVEDNGDNMDNYKIVVENNNFLKNK